MTLRSGYVWCLAVAGAGFLPASAEDTPVVFRSDVSLVRVDAQVVTRANRTVTGLGMNDFVVRDEGREQKITNFSNENMPVDVVLLFDVSTSMRPHVERIASAAHEALRALGDDDRVAIMVFDRSTRTRLPFRNSRADVEREFENLLRQESFNGGTDITRGLLDAARYVEKNARKEARRAIVIVTDDQTERNRDEEAVERALTRADAVLMALIAPDAMHSGRGRYPGGGGGYPGGGGGYPGGGGGLGGPLGGIILGRRGGYPGGRRYPGGGGPYPGGGTYGGTRSAGTSEIARASGGDSVAVDQASAFEDTLARIRQRYALHFHAPQGAKPGQERNIEVLLADAARRRYPDAEVRYRRVYLVPDGPGSTPAPNSEPVMVSHTSEPAASGATSTNDDGGSSSSAPRWRRRPAVDGNSSHDGPLTAGDSTTTAPADTRPSQAEPARRGGWRKADESAEGAGSSPASIAGQDATGTAKPSESTAKPADKPATQAPAPDPQPAPSQGGWRKVKPGEQP